ncbi:MAG: murein biosynthesis integral membrane protein MurJ [Anaerolineae bacterium]|nr:murein biosynthesis integral membrane protein MurJ [Anaerolineae bacterium]
MSAARPLSRLELIRATGTVMGAFLLSRVLGLVRELIIGQQFGTSGQLDAYLAAFRIPDLLFQLVAGGALASAFIPTFSTFLAREDADRAWYLMSNVVNALLALLAALSALAGVLAPVLVARVVAPGFPPERQALTVHLMRIMLLSPVIFGVSGVLMGVLNSFGRFLLPALAPAAYNLCIILGAWLLGPRMGVQGLALGVVAGAGLHLGVQVPALVRLRPRYTLALDLRFPGLREVARLMLPRSLGLGIVQLNFLVNTILASGLAAGSLAALNYAWLLMLLPQGILAQAVGTAVFPTLSALAAQARRDEMRDTLAATLRGLLFLAIPASLGLFFLRRPLVEVLFQRGAFTAQSTDLVAAALAFYAFGLAAHSALEVIARAFYALHDTLTPVLVGGLAMLVNVALGVAAVLTLRHRPDAHAYLALANTVATVAEAGILFGLLRRRLEGLGGAGLAPALLRILAASAGMGVFLAILPRLAPSLGSLAHLALGVAGGALVYLALAALAGAQEIRLVLAWRRGQADLAPPSAGGQA